MELHFQSNFFSWTFHLVRISLESYLYLFNHTLEHILGGLKAYCYFAAVCLATDQSICMPSPIVYAYYKLLENLIAIIILVPFTNYLGHKLEIYSSKTKPNLYLALFLLLLKCIRVCAIHILNYNLT